MSPAVEGVPYSSNSRIKSPNWPCRSPKILMGAAQQNRMRPRNHIYTLAIRNSNLTYKKLEHRLLNNSVLPVMQL